MTSTWVRWSDYTNVVVLITIPSFPRQMLFWLFCFHTKDLIIFGQFDLAGKEYQKSVPLFPPFPVVLSLFKHPHKPILLFHASHIGPSRRQRPSQGAAHAGRVPEPHALSQHYAEPRLDPRGCRGTRGYLPILHGDSGKPFFLSYIYIFPCISGGYHGTAGRDGTG